MFMSLLYSASLDVMGTTVGLEIKVSYMENPLLISV